MDEDFLELLRMAQRQFQLALDGERPIFCQCCQRPFTARRGCHPGEVEGAVYPRLHSVPGKGRDLCPGSHRMASLTP